MQGYVFPLLAMVGALALAGCNETAGGAMAGPVASAPTPVVMHTPAGASCSAEIDRFQAIVTSDRDTGNVDQKVYAEIEGDLSRAAAACAAGHGGEAHAIVSASKQHHGYRA